MEKSREFKTRLIIFIILLISLKMCTNSYTYAVNEDSKEEVINYIDQIFQRRNKAILSGDLELIKSIYSMDTKYGTWAYEYEKRKMDYINNWEEKQGVKFIDITPTIIIKRIKESNNNFSVYLIYTISKCLRFI